MTTKGNKSAGYGLLRSAFMALVGVLLYFLALGVSSGFGITPFVALFAGCLIGSFVLNLAYLHLEELQVPDEQQQASPEELVAIEQHEEVSVPQAIESRQSFPAPLRPPRSTSPRA